MYDQICVQFLHFVIYYSPVQIIFLDFDWFNGVSSVFTVGPCALEYTKMKTSDHYWSDPPADELLQRHKLHCRWEMLHLVHLVTLIFGLGLLIFAGLCFALLRQ